MTGLQRPPSQSEPRPRILLRFLVLTVLLLATGVVIWTAVVNQRIDLVEDVSPTELTLESPESVGGRTLNVEYEEGGPIPVILLHDFDIAGSIVWDDVARQVGGRYRAVRIDLPGYGLSDRLPAEGPEHTVASMAESVSSIIRDGFRLPVVIAGVGLGGKVGAEVAVTNPELVRGLVLIDVDFWQERGWTEILETLPWIGTAVTHTLETGGVLSDDRWAPNCTAGGWCPSAEQSAARGLATTISGSTDSIRSFMRTAQSSLIPSDLDLITTPTVYLWSSQGVVPEASVERFRDTLPAATVVEVSAWKAHLETPAEVLAAIDSVGG